MAYEGLDYFRGKRVAPSYPNILTRFFAEKGIDAEIHTIEGSVEIAPAVGMSDAIFDIVSSGGTLISNGLVEVEKVFYSEAVLIANPEMDEAKRRETAQLTFRFNSILEPPGGETPGSDRHPARHAQPHDPAAGAGGMVFDTRRDQRIPALGTHRTAQGDRRGRHPGADARKHDPLTPKNTRIWKC